MSKTVVIIILCIILFISVSYNYINSNRKTVIIDGKEVVANFCKNKDTDYINGKEVVKNYVMQVERIKQWQFVPTEEWHATLSIRAYKKGEIIGTDYYVTAVCASRKGALKKLKEFRIGAKEFIEKNKHIYKAKGFEIANTVDQQFE